MSDFYLILPVGKIPKPPTYWTFSLLNLWRKCPRQWWLSYSEYPNTKGIPYPSKVTAKGIQGMAVHAAIFEFGKQLASEGYPLVGSKAYHAVRRAFNLRETLKETINQCLELIKNNPRVKVNKISNRVALNDCVNVFKSLVGGCSAPGVTYIRKHDVIEPYESDLTYEFLPWVGSEKSVEISDPPLKGRIDKYYLTENGFVLREFKTGTQSADYVEQVTFYAVLIWLKTGKLPLEMTIDYPDRQEKMPLPTASDLEAFLANIQSEIKNYNQLIEKGEINADPSSDLCNYCNVKQLCEDFWKKSNNVVVEKDKTLRMKIYDYERADVEITFNKPRLGREFIERFVSREFTVKVDVNAKFDAKTSEKIRGCRIVFARTQRADNYLRVWADDGTEIFWIPDHGDNSNDYPL